MTILKCHYLGILTMTYCKYFRGIYPFLYTGFLSLQMQFRQSNDMLTELYSTLLYSSTHKKGFRLSWRVCSPNYEIILIS